MENLFAKNALGHKIPYVKVAHMIQQILLMFPQKHQIKSRFIFYTQEFVTLNLSHGLIITLTLTHFPLVRVNESGQHWFR